MTEKILNTKERILQLADNIDFSRKEFFKKINATYGNFTGKSKNSEPSNEIIREISCAFPQVSLDWLVKGEGEMLKSDTHPQEREIEHPYGQTKDLQPKLPLIPFHAVAGLNSTYEYDFKRNAEDYYVIPDWKGCDFVTRLTGDSMNPKYNHGDIVGCKLIKDPSIIQWGKVHILYIQEQGAVCKRIRKSTNPDNYILESDNKTFDPFEVPKKAITNIALVMGSITTR